MKQNSIKLQLADIQKDPLLYGFIASPKIHSGVKRPIEFEINKRGKTIIESKTRKVDAYDPFICDQSRNTRL